jgi:hypothetical protein
MPRNEEFLVLDDPGVASQNNKENKADKTPDFAFRNHVLDLRKEEPSAQAENETVWRPQPNEKLLFLKTIKELDKDGRQISRKIIDSGWEVSHIKDNLVYLRKHESKGDITDFAPIDELEKLNNPGRIDFTRAQNFIDLFALAKRNGGLQQGPVKYSVDEIKTVINRLVNGEIKPDDVTAANGFRQAAKNILAKETEPETKEDKFKEISLDEKIAEIKSRIQSQENTQKKEIAAANPFANIKNENPDYIPREKLDAMRHLDPEKVPDAAENFHAKKAAEKFDPEAHEKAIHEAYQKNEAAKDKEVVEKYQNSFGISAEDLKSVEGFDALSRGQKKFVLENLAQMALADVKDEAKEEFAAGFKSIAGKDKKFLEKAGALTENIWRGFSKTYHVAKLEKMKAQEVKQGGMKEYGEILKKLTEGMQDCPDVIEKNGRLEMQFLQAEGGSEVSGTVKKFNDAANEFMRLPKAWGYEDAKIKPGQKKLYEATKLRYEEARAEALNAMKEPFGEMNACVNMNNAEAKIFLNQFFDQNPDAENEIISLGNKNEFVRAFKDFGKGNRLAFGAGFVIRSLGVVGIGAIAAPIAGGVIGGWQSRLRAKESLVEKDRASRRGILDKSAEAKNFVDAEDLNSKLEKMIQEADRAIDDDKEFSRLLARINYTQGKIDKGLVRFGRDSEALNNQYCLMGKLAEAKSLWEIKRSNKLSEEVGEKKDLNSRLNKFLDFKKQNIGAKRAAYVNKKMAIGIARGACFASLGWALRHFAGEWFHWKTPPLLTNGIKKLFSIGQAYGDELPPLPSAGETEIRNVFLNRLQEFVPLAVHEHLPAAAMPHEHLAAAMHSGAEINPAGYQGGHSIWQEGAKQLEHHYDQFKHLNKNSQNFDINRLKNAVAADPEKFGLPKNIDINKVTADNLKNVRWNEAMREVFGNQKSLGDKINNLHEVLSQRGKHVVHFKTAGVEHGINHAKPELMDHTTIDGHRFDLNSPTYNQDVENYLGQRMQDFLHEPDTQERLRYLSDQVKKYLDPNLPPAAREAAINATIPLRQLIEKDYHCILDFDRQGNVSVIGQQAGGPTVKFSAESLQAANAENIAAPNNPPVEDSFTKVAQDMETTKTVQPPFHRPSLGYQNLAHARHAAENIAAAVAPAEPSGIHLHETVIENPNVGPDYSVAQPEKITGFFFDFKAAENLARLTGDLDLHNVKSISFQALNALQNKTNGAIYLTGLDPEKITDKGILQGLSELRKNIHVVMQDSVARKIDGWETQVAEHQPNWEIDKQGAFVAGDDNTTWAMNNQGQLNQAPDDANILTHHLAEQPATPSAAEHLAGAAKTEVIQPGQYNIPDGVPPAVFATEMRANPFAAIHKVKLLFADKYSFDQQKNISQYINTQIEERNELIKVLTEYGNKYDTKPKFLYFRDLMKQEILDENVQVAKLINGANNPAEDLSHAYVQMTGTGGPRAAAEIIAEKISRQANLLSPGDVAQNYFDQLPTHGSAAENIPVHQEVLNHPLPASLAPEKVLAIKNQVDGMYGKLRYADWTKLVNNSAAHKIVDNNQGVEAFITKNISLIQRGLGEMKATSDPSELAKLQEQIKDLVVMSEKKYGPILGIEKIYSDSIRTLAGL